MNTARKSGSTELPDGWRLMRLGDVAKVVTGSTPPREVYSAITTDVFGNRRITAGIKPS